MKIVTSLLICSMLFIIETPYNVKGKGFKGYIFDENHQVFISIENQSERYTPDKGDILKAEKLLKRVLRKSNEPLVNQGEDCPIIHKCLKKYVRQYVGFKNESGDKVIWINFLWKSKRIEEKISKDIIDIQDGCSHFWKIEVNLKQEELHNLKINSSS